MKRGILIIALVVGLFISAQPSLGGDATIYIMEVASPIGPGIVDFIEQGIAKASDENAALLIIELDTPGGLVDSMRDIVKAIYACKVPVAVYVSPSGARAASAGVMITIAADVAAMAPSTNIGAASPVNMGGKEVDETMSKKVTNDLVAFVRAIAEKRGRNVEWVEKAVREAVSVTETDALKENIIDVVAKDIDDLIAQINGRKIPEKGTLDLDDATRIRIRESLRTKILKTISDPNIAYILMMIGLAGLYFELSHPGAIFPGVVGGIALILAFFSFQTLPISTTGILLILLAIVFFIMEMKIASYGLLSIAGVISLLLGSLMLFESGPTGLQLSLSVILPTIFIISAFFVTIAYLVFRAQTERPMTGADGLIGKKGVVTKALKPEGKVSVHGELWHAVANESIAKGSKVRVVKVEDLVLEVEELV
ncbi:MAG: nodulation protein NfeD [Desulfobacterales bacterium]